MRSPEADTDNRLINYRGWMAGLGACHGYIPSVWARCTGRQVISSVEREMMRADGGYYMERVFLLNLREKHAQIHVTSES